jgi:Leucine-rich repeat (LRR) protein
MDVYLDLRNKGLKYLPEIPPYIKYLNCSHNELEELPELPSELIYLDCSFNKLKSLPKLPKTLKTLRCHNNQLAELPELPNGIVFEAENNLLTSMPLMSKESMGRFEGNPFSQDLYDIKQLNSKNISIENNEYYLTLKKGTILFHNMIEYDKYSEMYLGYKVYNRYILFPDHQVYFFLHPFCMSYGKITTINVLQNDVKMFLGFLPSNFNKDKIQSSFYGSCKKVEYKTKINSRYKCLSSKYSSIYGWIASDSHPKPGILHGENSNFMKYSKYVSYYRTIDGFIDRAEVQLYPMRKKFRKDIITNTSDYIDYIANNSYKYNYKTICMIENNNFKEYKMCIDSLLSKDGLQTNMGIYKMRRDKIDGLYYLN